MLFYPLNGGENIRKISIKNLTIYNNTNNYIRCILHKINFDVSVGEFVLITGKSGSGKTTILKVLSGHKKIDEGFIYIDGKLASEKDLKKYVTTVIFQESNLINSLTVFDNMLIFAYILGFNRQKDIIKIKRLLKKVGLEKFHNRRVTHLSGGQKQRLTLARALLKNSPVILADEPTSSQDKYNTKLIYDILKRESLKKIVIVISHKPYFSKKYADKIINIKNETAWCEIINIKSKKNIPIRVSKLSFKDRFLIIKKRVKGFFLCSLVICLSYIVLISSIIYVPSFYNKNNGYYDYGYNYALKDTSKKRFIINKKSFAPFNKKDYKSLKSIKNIKLIKDDTFIDETLLVKINNKKIIVSISDKTSDKPVLYLKRKVLKSKYATIKYENYTKKVKLNKIIKGKTNKIILNKRLKNDLRREIIRKYSNNIDSSEEQIKYKTPYFDDNLDNNDVYQLSLYIKDLKEYKDTYNTLINKGYNVLVVKDIVYNDLESIINIIILFKKGVCLITILLIFIVSGTLISLFINNYKKFYYIIFLLGFDFKDIKNLLYLELFIYQNISFFIISFLTKYKVLLVFSYIIILCVNYYITDKLVKRWGENFD